jgi:hypothetical protein
MQISPSSNPLSLARSAPAARTHNSFRHWQIAPRNCVKVLDDGGLELWQDFMDELRDLGVAPVCKRKARRSSVIGRLQAAYEAAVASAKVEPPRKST